MTASATVRESEDAPLIAHKTLAYRVIHRITQFLLFTVCRLEVQGRENLPTDGPAVIASNHQSMIDIPVVAAGTSRHVCFVARETLANTRWLAWVMRQCGAILIGRGTADRRALREMKGHLELGDLLAVFPEGTRTHDGSLGEFKGGAVLAAKRARAPIVPTAIRGAVDVLGRGMSWPRPRKIVIRFGPPIDSGDPDAQERLVRWVTDAVGNGRISRS